MGNVQDRWTRPGPPGGTGKPTRVRNARWGTGSRWLAEWVSPDGTRHRRAFPTKDEAKAHLEDQESGKRQGTYVAPNKVTLRDLWPKFQTMKSGLARPTRDAYDAAWSTYIEERWADVRVSDVDRAAVMEWLPTLRTRAGKHLSASWSRQVGVVLTGLMDMAVDARLIPANPLRKIRAAMPKQQPAERRYLSVAEVDRLVAAATRQGIGLMVRVLVMTGVRRGEAAGLRVGDLDVARGRLRVSRDIDAYGDVDATKTRRHRDVPVAGDLLALLVDAAAGRDRSAPLIPDPSGLPWRRSTWRPRWEAASAAAGVDVVAHELRHTAASLAIHSGANVKTVQRMLGHATAALTLDVYGHLWDDDLDALPVAMDRHIKAERARAEADSLHSPPVS